MGMIFLAHHRLLFDIKQSLLKQGQVIAQQTCSHGKSTSLLNFIFLMPPDDIALFCYFSGSRLGTVPYFLLTSIVSFL